VDVTYACIAEPNSLVEPLEHSWTA